MAKMTQKQKLTIVINAIEAAGYDSKAQLIGFLQTGNAAYITRQGGARALVKEINQTVLKKYLAELERVQAA